MTKKKIIAWFQTPQGLIVSRALGGMLASSFAIACSRFPTIMHALGLDSLSPETVTSYSIPLAVAVIGLISAWQGKRTNRRIRKALLTPPPQTLKPSNSQTPPLNSGGSLISTLIWLFAWLFIIIAAICFCSSCNTVRVTVNNYGPCGSLTNAAASMTWTGSTNTAGAIATGGYAINAAIYSHKTVAPDTTATIP
jgi:hypothetical protein